MTDTQQSPETQGSIGDSFSLIFLTADSLNDIEGIRIATENRLRSLKQVKGLEGSPEASKLENYLEQLKSLEKEAIKDIQKTMKAHPLGGFIKSTVGLGEKQAARLLATIGNPGDRDNVAKLWAYCGYHVVDGKAPKLTRGQPANWNNKARMRARLCAESCIKHKHSPYREIYELGRLKYEDQELTDLHKHNRALRLVAKAILKDLWIEAKRLQGELPETKPEAEAA